MQVRPTIARAAINGGTIIASFLAQVAAEATPFKNLHNNQGGSEGYV
jgi:predicted chitinase